MHGLATGGDASRLELTLVDDDGVFEWTSPQPVSFECAAFSAKPVDWPSETVPKGSKTLVPKNERLPVRATPHGDVVARVRVQEVHVTKEDKGVSAIAASTSLGVIVGFVDSAELVAPAAATAGDIGNPRGGGAGGGMGSMRPPHVTCKPGAPLFLLRDEKLYRVGHVHDTTDPPVAADWRVQPDGRVRLEVAYGQRSPRWIVLKDDFRVTNSFWHQGVSGEFVVPAGDACVMDAPSR